MIPYHGPFIYIHFNKAFDPILVVGNDGKEYNVIPSDQFK